MDPAPTAGAVMAKGSVLVYVGSPYHGGANTTDAHRVGVHVGYSPGWLHGRPSPTRTFSECRRSARRLARRTEPDAPPAG